MCQTLCTAFSVRSSAIVSRDADVQSCVLAAARLGILKRNSRLVLAAQIAKASTLPSARIAQLGHAIQEYKTRNGCSSQEARFNCQRFGHSQLCCRHGAACPRCGKEGHSGETCSADPWCPNCRQGGHIASSTECPKWCQEKAILTHRAQYSGTFAQARATLYPKGSTPKNTTKIYSEVLKTVPGSVNPTRKVLQTNRKQDTCKKQHSSLETEEDIKSTSSAPISPSLHPPSPHTPSSSPPSQPSSSSSPPSSSSPSSFSSLPPSSSPTTSSHSSSSHKSPHPTPSLLQPLSHHPSSNKAPPPTPRTRSPSSTRIQDSGPPPPPHSPSKKAAVHRDRSKTKQRQRSPTTKK
ncbi:putative protein TPRXL [Aplysia californica]|uniref:CCHC-type domain-containing protein n=1 Tax=Aplysia californica TaxID=6500 RepID=A0ABM1ADE8_APLCA|nr:putative protein TPRXL [Aplysia californica]